MSKKIIITFLLLITLIISLGVAPVRAALDINAVLTDKLFTAGKELIVKVYDLVITYYANLDTKTNSNRDLTNEEKTRLLAQINPAKDYFITRKPLVAEANDQAELTVLLITDKDKWDEYQVALRQVQGEIFYARVEAVKAQLDLVAENSRQVAAILAQVGKDTAELNNLINQYEAKIDEAEVFAKKGVDVYRTIINLKDLPKLKAAIDNLVAAWNKLEEARITLEQMLREAQRLLGAS